MSAWRVSKRATLEREGGSARDSKLPKNGGKELMRASARSAASYEDSPANSIVALQKLSLKHDWEIREEMEAGADLMEEVKKRGRGHGLGAPHTHVAAVFVEALAVEAEGAPEQVLTTFMALVAARQEAVTECFGAFMVEEAYSADETPAAQRKAKVTVAFNALGVIKNGGGGAATQDEGIEVRDVRRAIAQTPKAKGAETEVGAGPRAELVRSVEKQLRDLQSAHQK